MMMLIIVAVRAGYNDQGSSCRRGTGRYADDALSWRRRRWLRVWSIARYGTLSEPFQERIESGRGYR